MSLEDPEKSAKWWDQQRDDYYRIGIFIPGVTAVISVSAPAFLLSASLNSFVTGLGIYLAIVWRRSLDDPSGPNDSRNIFIMYVVAVIFCYLIYSFSALVQDTPEKNVLNMSHEGVKDFMHRLEK
jgi:hypothetical protein